MRFAAHKLLVSVDDVVGIKLFPTTLADKHMATVLLKFVLVRCWQRFESLVTDITRGWNLYLFCALSPLHRSHPAITWIPSQTHPQHLQVQVPADEHPFSCSTESWSFYGRWCSRWQSWFFCVPSTWPGIWETAGSMDDRRMVRQAGLSWKVLITVAALFLQTEQCDEWQVMWFLRGHHILHNVGSLCIFPLWLFNFYLLKTILKQELQGKETSDKRDQGGFDNHALLHHQAVMHNLLIPPLPLYLLLLMIILLLILLILLLLPLLQEVWMASRRSLLSCRDL